MTGSFTVPVFETMAIVVIEFYFFIFFFSLPFVLFLLLNIYKNPHIYCYINTTNFTIFSFSTVVLHYSYSVFHCSSTVPFWLATFFFVFCLYFFSPYIYTVFLHCACTIAATVLWFRESFFILFYFFSVISLCFFFSFKYWCKLTFILLYWHNKFHNYWRVNFLQGEIK